MAIMARGLTPKLLAWFRRRRRDLPWRRTRSPYRIWIAEIMLQQTRSAAVVPYYRRFLRRFTGVKSLSRAREGEVLALWSGLGYYSRARNLRRAAQQILTTRGGGLPHTYEEWRTLPGVGPYTAAAIASIGYGEPVAVLDGNVARVMARLTARRGDIRSPRVREELRLAAQELLDRRNPGDFNQALMELGATVCLPRGPRCPACPLARWCQARRLGLVNKLPVRRRTPAPVEVHATAAVARRNGRILMRRRPPAASLMPGFWELPPADTPGLRLAGRLGAFRHSITNHQYTVEVFAAVAPTRPPTGCRWMGSKNIARLPLTTIARKALQLDTS